MEVEGRGWWGEGHTEVRLKGEGRNEGRVDGIDGS